MTKKTKRSTTSPTTVMVNDSKSRTDLFTGKPKPVDKDGDCLYSSLATIVRSNKKIVREKIADWLRVNPKHPLPLQSCTLSEYVMYETGEVWSVYCARMQREGTWAGLPELVAASQIWHRVIRVFENVGDGLFHLRAVLGEEGFLIVPIDLALGSDHFDVLTEARPLQTTPTETTARDGSAKLEPIDHIATLADWLALILGRLEEFTETTKNREEIDERTARNEVAARKELKQLEEIVERTVRHELAALKELKQLEERKTREQHKMRKELAERKALEELAQRKALEELTERATLEKAARKEFKHDAMTTPKELETPATAEACCKPDNPALDARKKHKYKHESRKARAVRE